MDPIVDIEVFLSDIVGVPSNLTVHIKVNLTEPIDENVIIEQLNTYCDQSFALSLAEKLTQKNHFYRIANHLVKQIKIQLQ